jgi:predicted membrane metal-binding protein
MNQQQWLKLTLTLSILLLGLTIGHEKLALNRPYRWSPTLKLPYPPSSSADSTSFWEATLNGNSKSISKQTKNELKALGLAHIYTPSGLHLSLILNPVFLFIKSTMLRSSIVGILLLLTTFYIPSWGAVKRVLELKLFKSLLSPFKIESKFIFLTVMFLDLVFGTYQDGSLSFCFSFMFLSLIYTRMNFLVSAWWFFIAQIIIAIFLEQHFFITNIILTPLLTLLFSLLFPVLIFLRVIPAWHFLGTELSDFYLKTVHLCYEFSLYIPSIEAIPYLLVIILFILFPQKKGIILGIALFSGSLNLNQNQYQTSYLSRKYYFVSESKKGCYVEGGFEKCSYFRRSTKKKL